MNIAELNFRKTHKMQYSVYVCKPKIGTKVHNKLELVDYETTLDRPYVISGTVGETWIVDTSKLINTYEFLDDSPLSLDTLSSFETNSMMDWIQVRTKSKSVELMYAAHLPLDITNYPVETSWGDTLYANRDGIQHGTGDYIVCTSLDSKPNLSDVWVVNGEVFKYTYSMREFEGTENTEVRQAVKPKSLIA